MSHAHALHENPTAGYQFFKHFMGNSPVWYKNCIILFLILNPILLATTGPFVAGWALMFEFIFTLAMALKCYPLPAGGLLAVEAVVIGLTDAHKVYEETHHNFPVILLLMFMVAGIHFMRELLELTFTKILLFFRSKLMISVVFCLIGAFLSAFLDALTVIAVAITVCTGFYMTYEKWHSAQGVHDTEEKRKAHRQELESFRAFLCSVLMHAAVGTALGGVLTLVGEPQNLIIGHEMKWGFVEFFHRMSPVTIPVFITGIVTCLFVEKFRLCGHGTELPANVRSILAEAANTPIDGAKKSRLIIQALAGIFIIVALALHLAEVGLIGLTVIVVLTAGTGKSTEHEIGESFTMALPFTGLLVVFFVIVAVISDQQLFSPIIHWVLSFEGKAQLLAFYGANGLLSSISDNVFVATVYMTEAQHAHATGAISHDQLELVAVAINTGTNIPSVATPNGQAAFLFLLTSPIAALIRLGYMRMMILALPYTITMSAAGAVATWLWLN